MSATFLAALGCAAQIWVGAAFLASGLGKARDLRAASSAVADYRLLPHRLVAGAAVATLVLELATGAGLLAGQQSALPIAFVLISTFSLAAASALKRGLDISCHCAGSDDERLSSKTLIRNGVFLTAVVLASATSPWRWSVESGSLLSPITLPIALAAGLALAGSMFLWSARGAFATASNLGRTL
jgi:hypothetical protein